ncbi:hypothetical protein NDU88_001864 [Pleurodeles waltl]|uniref:Uncharacterized protein n=1 Tax=Pleurodeles waltl TaxID=8319 RepID=A0AAV7TIZ7_PLEWA|nr:hypothetical protein NDU88_001864 [Pleurodeles waltl]
MPEEETDCTSFALKIIDTLEELKTLQENADKEVKKLSSKLKCLQRPDEIWVSEEGQMVLPNCLLTQMARHTKRVVSTQDHEEVLLRAPTAAKQIVLPEPEPEQVEPELEPELAEDGSIIQMRDESAEAQETEQENNLGVTGEPSTGKVLSEANGDKAQGDQVPEPEGEKVETDRSQSDLTPPEPVAGPSREGTTDKTKEKSLILK